MRGTQLVVTLLLFVAAAIAQQPWTWCGTAADKFQISSVTITPASPIIGQNVQVAVSGKLSEVVTSATAKINVLYGGSVPIFDQTVDACSLFPGQLTCPLTPDAKGNYQATVSQQIPSFAPAGEYSGQINLYDQNGQEVACVKFDLNFNNQMEMALNDEIIAKVNKAGKWQAHRSPRFEGVTRKEARQLLGTTIIPKPGYVKSYTAGNSMAIPAAFDSRTQWPTCIHPIRDQQQCGSCWAFSATEVLSDRFCIASNGSVNVVLSPEDMVSCDQVDQGCNGGYLNSAWDYLVQTGVVQDSCFPYTAGNGNAPPCRSTCVDGKPWTKYFAQSGSVQNPTDIPSMQTAIINGGPVQAAFSVYQDFFAYKSGVYTHQYGDLDGGHAIKIVGWGVEQSTNTPYWIVANSWGPSWGMDGFFWIARGVDECGIEDDVYFGNADLSGSQ